MKVLITGGAGFIGSHLVEASLGEGHEVVVLDDFSTGREENLAAVRDDVVLVRGDIRDTETVQAALDGVDAVLHHAAWVSVPGSLADPAGSAEVNVMGTARILEEAREAGVKRIVFASSSAVYGDTRVVPTPEETETVPLSPYGAQKLTGEQLCRVMAETGGPDTLSFRYFNVYGPRQRADSDYAAVIPIFRERCRNGGVPCIHGNGDQERDFVFVGDVVEANLRAIAHPEPWRGIVVNVARGEPTRVADLADLIQDLEGRHGEALFAPAREGDITRSVADVTRLERLFGWSPEVELRQGLRSEAAS